MTETAYQATLNTIGPVLKLPDKMKNAVGGSADRAAPAKYSRRTPISHALLYTYVA